MTKERPILFSADMVRAILDGSKTQTRRVIKPQPAKQPFRAPTPEYYEYWFVYHIKNIPIKCPFGKPGDQLWVRESFRLTTIDDCSHYDTCWCTSGGPIYAADFSSDVKEWGPWKPSIHMPRWVSRIQLEIKEIRVERLQDISEDDAEAEGVLRVEPDCYGPGCPDQFWATGQFQRLWDSINAKRGFGWCVNPCVWVIEFERIKP